MKMNASTTSKKLSLLTAILAGNRYNRGACDPNDTRIDYLAGFYMQPTDLATIL